MATDPLLFFVAIFGELAIFEVGHIPEDALNNPEKYEDGHEIAVREIEGEVFPGNEAKMATWYEDAHQKKQGHVGQVRTGHLRCTAIGTPEKKPFSRRQGEPSRS